MYYTFYVILYVIGYFRFIKTVTLGRPNERNDYTISDLFLKQGEMFSDGELLAADGGYTGTGNLLYSHNNMNDRNQKLFNLTFTEVRKGVENSFGRVQMWFPILGNQKSKWNYDEETLYNTTQAACRLHNWMMHNRLLKYSASTNPKYLFRSFYELIYCIKLFFLTLWIFYMRVYMYIYE